MKSKLNWLVGAGLLALTPLALAEAPKADRPGRSHGPGSVGRAGFRGLDLTDEQKAEIRALREQQRKDMEPVREEGRALRQSLRQALEADRPDANAVGQAMIRLKAHRQKVEAAREAFHEKFTALLTPEQKAKLEDFRKSHPRGRGRRGFGPGRGFHAGPGGHGGADEAPSL